MPCSSGPGKNQHGYFAKVLENKILEKWKGVNAPMNVGIPNPW
jgi:hypothetical protein